MNDAQLFFIYLGFAYLSLAKGDIWTYSRRMEKAQDILKRADAAEPVAREAPTPGGQE